MEPAHDLPNLVKSELLAETVRIHGQARIRVTGASMLPAVWPGDVLTVRREYISQLTPGTIVLCRRQGQLLAHRVARHCGKHLITRGDALAQNDTPVMAAEIIGRVTAIVREQAEIPIRRPLWARTVSAVLSRSDIAVFVFLRLFVKQNST